jgi:hypothetical protein
MAIHATRHTCSNDATGPVAAAVSADRQHGQESGIDFRSTGARIEAVRNRRLPLTQPAAEEGTHPFQEEYL